MRLLSSAVDSQGDRAARAESAVARVTDARLIGHLRDALDIACNLAGRGGLFTGRGGDIVDRRFRVPRPGANVRSATGLRNPKS